MQCNVALQEAANVTRTITADRIQMIFTKRIVEHMEASDSLHSGQTHVIYTVPREIRLVTATDGDKILHPANVKISIEEMSPTYWLTRRVSFRRPCDLQGLGGNTSCCRRGEEGLKEGY